MTLRLASQMPDQIHCTLFPDILSSHTEQILTGFQMLADIGLLTISHGTNRQAVRGQSFPPKAGLLKVLLNNNAILYYDVRDGNQIDEDRLSESQLYFKRSFSRNSLLHLGAASNKVFPLGFNYLVFPRKSGILGLTRAIRLQSGISRLSYAFRALGFHWPGGFVPRVDYMWSPPDFDADPMVLFMARTWPPNDDATRPKEKAVEREQINEMRAACIRLLRREFRGKFFGGFSRSDFAKKHYGDVLLNDESLSIQHNYLNRMRSFPICIATTGLHGSIGWKMGEYVAFSKAIVSEALLYQVPGNFKAEQNYLQFGNVDECVSQVTRLMQDKSLRNQLMLSNFDYYQRNLRPDNLVMNTLITAIGVPASMSKPHEGT